MSTPPVLSPDDKPRLFGLWVSTMPLTEVAAAMGVSVGSVRRAAKRWGLPERPPVPPKPPGCLRDAVRQVAPTVTPERQAAGLGAPLPAGHALSWLPISGGARWPDERKPGRVA